MSVVTVPAPNRDRAAVALARRTRMLMLVKEAPMTEVHDWRGGVSRKHVHLPLPEPPRFRHESKSAPVPKNGTEHALEDWLHDLSVASTQDAD